MSQPARLEVVAERGVGVASPDSRKALKKREKHECKRKSIPCLDSALASRPLMMKSPAAPSHGGASFTMVSAAFMLRFWVFLSPCNERILVKKAFECRTAAIASPAPAAAMALGFPKVSQPLGHWVTARKQHETKKWKEKNGKESSLVEKENRKVKKKRANRAKVTPRSEGAAHKRAAAS